MTAHQQLRPGALLQRQGPLRSARFRGVEKFFRGFGRPAGICQRVTEANSEIDHVRRIGLQFDRPPVIQCGPIKGQRARRFAGRSLGVQSRAIFFAGA